MSGPRRGVAVTLSTALVLAGPAFRGESGGDSRAKPASSAGDGWSAPPPDQKASARERSGNGARDASAFATLVAQNPMSAPPSPNPKYITLEDIAARVRGSAAATPEFHARFMKYRDAEPLFGAVGNAIVNPERVVWVVTVHADVWTRGSPTRLPQLVHYYTVVIDGETGMVSDSCIGCNLITS